MGFLIRMAITAAGLWLAARLVPGVTIDDTTTLVWAALLLGLVNAFVRPVAVFLTFPITIVTLGLFLWVVNAAMLGLVASLLDGFRVAARSGDAEAAKDYLRQWLGRHADDREMRNIYDGADRLLEEEFGIAPEGAAGASKDKP